MNQITKNRMTAASMRKPALPKQRVQSSAFHPFVRYLTGSYRPFSQAGMNQSVSVTFSYRIPGRSGLFIPSSEILSSDGRYDLFPEYKPAVPPKIRKNSTYIRFPMKFFRKSYTYGSFFTFVVRPSPSGIIYGKCDGTDVGSFKIRLHF